MRRRRLYLSIGLVSGFVLLIVAALAMLVKSEPGFYVEAEMPPGPSRSALSHQFDQGFVERLSVLGKDSWEIPLTAEELNAYFQEDHIRNGGAKNLPEGFHDPRVKIEDGKMRLGLRYGQGLFSTIVSIELKVWKVQAEVNMLAVEVVSLKAGRLPLSSSLILEQISEEVRHENVEINWFRKDGHPVAIMRFQAVETRPTFQFDKIELTNGKLTVLGRSSDVIVPTTKPNSP